MITKADLMRYLDQAYGVSLPELVLSSAVDRVATAEPAMIAAGYTASDIALMQVYAASIIACAGQPRRIASQGSPSGASRSFVSRDDSISQLRRALSHLDTAGTLADVVGPDARAGSFFAVVG